MLKDVTFGQYFPGDSVVHKMDPRMKLVLIIVYIVMLFVADGIIPLLLGVAVTVFAYAMSKLSFKLVWRSVKPILPIVVFTAILNIFFIEGDPLFQWKFITISERGVVTAVLMCVRIISLIAGSSLLTYTTTPIALTDSHFARTIHEISHDDEHSIYEYADSFTLIQPSIHVREVVYGLLWDLACVDNTLSQAELDILRAVVRNLRINPALFEWEARRRGVATGAADGVAPEEDPYEVIGCCGNASNEELRSAYREKAKQLHPDVLKAQGLSEELMSRANAQMSRINAAWAKIKKERRL